ncbi:hypothetical protein A4G20_00050 [Pasteurellaceae bacterium RH1A]|nr:hypothetical protein A4G20_00050 [Pasteurellaceae bacterium RH1A]
MLDNRQKYGTVSRFLHWSMALCFGFMLYTGLAGEETFKALMPYHKSVGTILMGLLVIRIIWAIANRKNRPPAGNIMVTLGHLALYVLMIAVPVIALIRQYGGARGPLEVFGVNVMDGAAEKIDWMVNLGGLLHGELAWALFALVGGHIVMAIYHQIKGEKIINRMAGK